MNIEQASKYINVSVSTLRRWEEEGKITPERTDGGHRRYNEEQLSSLKRELLLKKNHIDIATMDEVEEMIDQKHVFIHGRNKSEQTAFAKAYVNNRLTKEHIGLILGDFEEWKSVSQSTPNVQHFLFGYHQGIQFNPFLIPNGVYKDDWANALVTVFNKTRQLREETERAFYFSLISYFTWEHKKDTTEDFLVFSLEYFLRNNISYSDCSPIIEFLKEMKYWEEEETVSDYFETSLSDLISPHKTVFLLMDQKNITPLEYIFVSLMVDYFAMFHMIHKSETAKFLLIDEDNFINKETDIGPVLTNVWDRGRIMKQHIVFLSSRSDYIPHAALCQSTASLFFKENRRVLPVERLLEDKSHLEELRKHLQVGEAIVTGLFHGRGRNSYLYR